MNPKRESLDNIQSGYHINSLFWNVVTEKKRITSLLYSFYNKNNMFTVRTMFLVAEESSSSPPQKKKKIQDLNVENYGMRKSPSAASRKSLDLDKDGVWMIRPLGERLLGHWDAVMVLKDQTLV